MHKALSLVLSLVLVFTLCIVETGCSQSKFDNTLKIVQAQIPAAIELAKDVAVLLNAPELASISAAVAQIASTDLPVLGNIVDAYFAHKSDGAKSAIFAAFNTAQSALNAQFLAANHITNSQSQQAALAKLAALAAVVNGFQLALAPFFNQTATVAVPYSSVQAYIPRMEKEKVAKAYGYTLQQAEAIGL